MRRILFSFLTILSFCLCAQYGPARVSDLELGDVLYRDSVHYSYFTSSGEKYVKFKDYFEHNDFGYFLQGNKVIYDSMSSTYIEYVRWNNTFDEYNNLTSKVEYSWNREFAQWEKSDSTYQEFDDLGNRVVLKTFSRESKEWKGVNYYLHQYNDAKEIIQYSRYDWIDNDWKLVYEDGFNDDRNRTVLLNYSYDSEGIIISSYEGFLEYDSDGKLLKEESVNTRENYYYKRESNHYYEDSKKNRIDVYHGNSSDELSLLQVSHFTYDASTQYEEIYVLESKYELITTSHDEMGNATFKLSQQWSGNEWRNYYRVESDYDEQKNKIHEFWEFWDVNGNFWKLNSKVAYKFDDLGNRILRENYVWNNNLSLWQGDYKLVNDYDHNNNLLLRETYNDWDEDRQDWIGDDKDEYQYIADDDGFRDSFAIDYNWDYSSGDWIKNYEKLSFFSTTSSRVLGVKELSQLVIYPNPTHSYFKIKSVSEINYIQIFDESGRLLHEEGRNEIYEIENLSKGIYLVKVNDESGETYIKRLVKN